MSIPTAPLKDAVFVAPRVPLIDGRTGLVTREWYLFFQSLASLLGPVDLSNYLAPQDHNELTASAVNSLADAVNSVPPSQTIYFAADDVLPAIGALHDRIAMLERQLNDIRQGGVVL